MHLYSFLSLFIHIFTHSLRNFYCVCCVPGTFSRKASMAARAGGDLCIMCAPLATCHHDTVFDGFVWSAVIERILALENRVLIKLYLK